MATSGSSEQAVGFANTFVHLGDTLCSCRGVMVALRVNTTRLRISLNDKFPVSVNAPDLKIPAKYRPAFFVPPFQVRAFFRCRSSVAIVESPRSGACDKEPGRCGLYFCNPNCGGGTSDATMITGQSPTRVVYSFSHHHALQ